VLLEPAGSSIQLIEDPARNVRVPVIVFTMLALQGCREAMFHIQRAPVCE